MNLQRIIDTERAAALLESRLSPMLEHDLICRVADLRNWAAEIRHFAVIFDDIDKAQAAGQMDQERGAQHREEAITRLVQFFRPN